MFGGSSQSTYAASWWQRSAFPEGGFQIALSWISRKPRRTGETRAELGIARGQHRCRQRSIRLPDVAELAGLVGRGDAGLVVHLVGSQPRLPLVRERAREVLAHSLDLGGGEERLEDDEPIAPVRVDLGWGRVHGAIMAATVSALRVRQ